MKNCAIIALVVLTLRAGVAGPPLMLGDIHPEGSASPDQLAVCGPYLLFVAEDGISGRELWRTDGSPEGTTLTKDVSQGPVGSNIESLFPFGSKLLFLADDGVHGQELWTWEDEEARLVKDIHDGTAGSNIGIDDDGGEVTPRFLTIEDTTYFVANDGQHGAEIWETNGRLEGTDIIHDFLPGPDAYDIDQLTSFKQNLYYILENQSLYRFDQGIGELQRIDEAYVPQNGMHELQPAGDKLFVSINFGAFDGALAYSDGERLWRVRNMVPTDGAEGTRVEMLTPFGERFYFRLVIFERESDEYFEEGDETWGSDGTHDNTTMAGRTFFKFHGVFKDHLYFSRS